MTDAIALPEWLSQWLAMLDRRRPGWRREFDPADFERAIADVFGAAPPVHAAPADLDLLGDFSLDPEALLGEDLPALRRASFEFEYVFRRSHGSSAASPPLRRMRALALEKMVAAALEPVARRFGRLSRAAAMREKRRARRHPRLERADLLADRAGADPGAEAEAREAAGRVADRLRLETRPAVRDALRRRLFESAPAPPGVSPATMSRALRRFRELAAEELGGSREAALSVFFSALADQLSA